MQVLEGVVRAARMYKQEGLSSGSWCPAELCFVHSCQLYSSMCPTQILSTPVLSPLCVFKEQCMVLKKKTSALNISFLNGHQAYWKVTNTLPKLLLCLTPPPFLFFNIIIIFSNLVFKTADIYCVTVICRILVQALEKVMATHSSMLPRESCGQGSLVGRCL